MDAFSKVTPRKIKWNAKGCKNSQKQYILSFLEGQSVLFQRCRSRGVSTLTEEQGTSEEVKAYLLIACELDEVRNGSSISKMCGP